MFQKKKEESGASKPTADTVEQFTHSLICETYDEKSSASGDNKSRPSTCSMINSQGSEVELKDRN